MQVAEMQEANCTLECLPASKTNIAYFIPLPEHSIPLSEECNSTSPPISLQHNRRLPQGRSERGLCQIIPLRVPVRDPVGLQFLLATKQSRLREPSHFESVTRRSIPNWPLPSVFFFFLLFDNMLAPCSLHQLLTMSMMLDKTSLREAGCSTLTANRHTRVYTQQQLLYKYPSCSTIYLQMPNNVVNTANPFVTQTMHTKT